MSFIATQRLEYRDHSEEIAALNRVLADIQASGDRPDLTSTVKFILARLDLLMKAEKAVLA